MPIPRNTDADTFSLLTDHQLGQDSRLDMLLCSDMFSGGRTASSTPSRLSCHYNTLSAIPVPASTTGSHSASQSGRNSRGQEFRYISQKLVDLSDVEYVAVLDRGRRISEPGFLIAEFTAEADVSMTVKTTTLGKRFFFLCFSTVKFDLHPFFF